MPFIGRDWRSPGEAWVKTDEGWERKKILERLNRRVKERTLAYERHGSLHAYNSDGCNSDSDGESNNKDIHHLLHPDVHDIASWQPYCHITIKSTREVAGYNIISEAFHRLDFQNAVRDIRRFNYICKLLHLLITQNLTTLSGCATKVLFAMLEQVAWQVSSNQQNIHILHILLHDLKKTMRKYYCWGRPIGSTLLWDQHLRTIERICHMASSIEIKQPNDDGRHLTDLPTELIREILLRLSDYKDLMRSGQAYDVMQSLLDEQHIWRELCKFHYSRQQVRHAVESHKTKNFSKRTDWQQVFHQLRKKFGLKEEYADCLFLCRHCRCLFWKSFGHPCLEAIPAGDASGENVDEDNEEVLMNPVPMYIPVPPQAFLKFFSL